MRLQILIQQNVKSKYFKADISIFVASLVAAGDLRFVGDTRLNNNILNSVHNLRKVDAIPLKPLLQLKQIPLRGILLIIALIIATALYIVICPLIHRVIRQMNEPFLEVLGIIRILLRGKPNQTFLKKENLKWIKASHEYVNSQIILKAFDQMWIWNVLGYDVASPAGYLSLWANYFDAFAAWASWWLHDVHQLIPSTFPLNTKLPIILRKNVSLRTKVKVIGPRMYLLRPLNILPHQVLPTHLKALRKVIYFLIFWSNLQLFWLTESSPKYIPFAAVWRHYTNTRSFHGINHRIVNMRRIMHFESKSHVLVHHAVLMYNFNLQGIILLDFLAQVNQPHKRFWRFNSVAILRIGKENTNMLRKTLQNVRLHQMNIRIMRLHDTSRNLPLFPLIHRIGDHLRIKPLQFFFILLFIKLLLWYFVYLFLSFNQLLLTRHPFLSFLFFLSWIWNVWWLLLNRMAPILRLLISSLCCHLSFLTFLLRRCINLLRNRLINFTAILALVDNLIIVVLITLLVVVIVIVAEALRSRLHLLLPLIIIISHIPIILIKEVILVINGCSVLALITVHIHYGSVIRVISIMNQTNIVLSSGTDQTTAKARTMAHYFGGRTILLHVRS